MLETLSENNNGSHQKDYSIFKNTNESTDSKITELADQGKFSDLRKLFIDSGLSGDFKITEKTSDEDTLCNIIVEMFKHTSELETAGVTKFEISCVKNYVYNVLDTMCAVNDEVFLAGNDYLLSNEG